VENCFSNFRQEVWLSLPVFLEFRFHSLKPVIIIILKSIPLLRPQRPLNKPLYYVWNCWIHRPREAYPIIITGLKRLEYRGYDSTGVAMQNGGLKIYKKKGKLLN